MRETLLLELARIEAALDDPEHLALDEAYTESLQRQIRALTERADRMIASYRHHSLIDQKFPAKFIPAELGDRAGIIGSALLVQ